MTQGPESRGYHTSEDEHLLHRLGYAQELFRAMGGFRNFAISFTIISILAGCLTSYSIGFEHGGPMWVVFGWLLVGLMATIIALAWRRSPPRIRQPAVSTTGRRSSAARAGAGRPAGST